MNSTDKWNIIFSTIFTFGVLCFVLRLHDKQHYKQGYTDGYQARINYEKGR